MNYIVTDDYRMPVENFDQTTIFNNQKEKYIEKDATVSVLSGFPVFVFDYFGYTKLLRIIG